MYIREYKQQTRHKRISKCGKMHEYTRHCTYVQLRCDNCDTEFIRSRGSMDPARLSNNYFHVCKNCNSKKFAQKKGIEKKQIWNISASSNLSISKL
jgi:hypothetical protein